LHKRHSDVTLMVYLQVASLATPKAPAWSSHG